MFAPPIADRDGSTSCSGPKLGENEERLKRGEAAIDWLRGKLARQRMSEKTCKELLQKPTHRLHTSTATGERLPTTLLQHVISDFYNADDMLYT